MLTSLHLRDFKAYRDSGPVPLRPLTVIVGANNSGKSSLLHAILLLAQTLEDTSSRQALVTSGAYVDLGGFYDILWGSQSAGEDTFSISLQADPLSIREIWPSREHDGDEPFNLDVRFAFDADRNAVVVSSCTVSGKATTFASARRAGNGYMAPHLDAASRDIVTVDFRHFIPVLVPAGESEGRRPKYLDVWMRSDQAWFTWSGLMSGIAHVAPLRQPVPRFGILGKSPTSELGPGGENLLRVLRAGDDGAHRRQRLVTEVNTWVSERFRMLKSLKLVDVDEAGTILALLGDERRGFSNINVANMGEGLSQLLPIVARVLTTRSGGSLLIEQPELHLHPAAQADLADLFIAGVQPGDRQYIIETHSEHLLLRLRRRIAERAIDPSQVAVLYVERRGSSSSVRPLDLDSDGTFDEWPEGFFDERYREALAIVSAAQSRSGGAGG